MHFIIDDQPPIIGVEQLKMRVAFLELVRFFAASFAIGHRLVGRNGDGANLFALAGVFADQGWVQVGLIDELFYPLPYTHRIRGENKRAALGCVHHR